VTPLAKILARRIAAAGPITVAEYMAECLLHPEHGYYTTQEAFGARGDFTTAPEISQMFGEMIGLALAQAWMDQGRPARFCLAELGPGRGTLMADILRATRTVAGFGESAEIHLVEASPRLRALQRDTIGPDADIRWHDTVHGLPDLPLFLVANEFFDALPIRQFQRAETGWCERMIGLEKGVGVLAFGLSAPAPLAALAHRLADTKAGDIVELCPPAAPVIAAIGERIAHRGGAALIIDYGGGPSLGDTLQALRHHAPDDPLANPGEADLTAHVDFIELARVTPKGLDVTRVGQGVFLEQLGITARARALARNLSGAALDSHIAAHRRLTHPGEMGTLFQLMALTPKGRPPIAGSVAPATEPR
jgi:SAM-dependent MidA family methyltransferase